MHLVALTCKILSHLKVNVCQVYRVDATALTSQQQLKHCVTGFKNEIKEISDLEA